MLTRKATAAELHVKELLEALDVSFCFQKGFFTASRHYIVDFYIKSFGKLCLEIDGGYHQTPEQQAYDQRRDLFLADIRGFRVKRLTNEAALAMSADDLLAFCKPTLDTYVKLLAI